MFGRVTQQATSLDQQGSFNNCVDQILTNFDSLPPLSGTNMGILHTIYPLPRDHLSHFLLTPFPPLLVHLVIECPPSVCMSSYSCYMHVLLHLILDPRNDFKVGGTQKMTLIKILPYTAGVWCDRPFYLVKQPQEKWACDFHDDVLPLSFQLQVTEVIF